MGRSFDLTREELKRIGELGGLSVGFIDKWDLSGGRETSGFGPEIGFGEDVPEIDLPALMHAMAEAVFSEDSDEFARFVVENRPRIQEAIMFCEDGGRVSELLVLGYRFGIMRGSGACMNDLGACYYRGDFVGQDYRKAKELYEMAASHGVLQSTINLGYIYEYGRTGEPDYTKAYECYALAAALTQSSEAVYKLGDMYSRGRPVERDLGRAHALWERSLEIAKGYAQQAQPAVRIAKLLIDSRAAEWGIELDPMRALVLFQIAEVGLRLDIADGLTYYRKRLREAIDGQAKARELLERGEDVSTCSLS